MPAQLYDRIKKMHKAATFQSILWVLFIFHFLVSLGSVFSGSWNMIVCILFAISVVCVCLIILIARHFKKNTAEVPSYCLRIPIGTIQEAVELFDAKEVARDAYVSFCTINGISVRLLIQYAQEYDKTMIVKQRKNANRIINQQFQISSDVPMYKALSNLRVNLVICDQINQEMRSWVERDARMLFSRNEAIVSAAIGLNEKALLFPALYSNVMPNQVKRYKAAVLLFENLVE